MARRNLLLAFDAFGTLFRIKQPIERQYGDVARQHFPGLLAPSIDDAQLRASFRHAFKAQARAHPNYGHKPNGDGMGATAWWTQVIHNTFEPLLRKGATQPPVLAPLLLARFASSEGYAIDPRLPGLLRAIKDKRVTPYERVVVGVITNSDDRVPGILSSFGVNVSPLRYSRPRSTGEMTGTQATKGVLPLPCDIDFHCMSYDVGVEKPDPAIFRAAESLVPEVVGLESEADLHKDWDRVYVGDEAGKDLVGAQAAGWYPVLLTGHGSTEGVALNSKAVLGLSEQKPQLFSDLFGLPANKVVALTENAVTFLQWLQRTGEQDEPRRAGSAIEAAELDAPVVLIVRGMTFALIRTDSPEQLARLSSKGLDLDELPTRAVEIRCGRWTHQPYLRVISSIDNVKKQSKIQYAHSTGRRQARLTSSR
ncbi:hypothetical protein SEPCBS57363_002055 [Sporothrix epigloea]|uniref:Haloacid dehalogenase n=1 Tax=Sporothrix epigloea TaxID=1892477 RepID=A0ABP0DDR0_9PEZI